MGIDFSKAPEGATHYSVVHGDFYRDVGAGPEFFHDDREEWVRSFKFTSLSDVTPIPTTNDLPSRCNRPNGSDPVNSPSHYTTGSVECIDAIKASMTPEAYLGYLKGNVQKYLWRYEKKANPVEDLKKAQWYLARLVSEQEGE